MAECGRGAGDDDRGVEAEARFRLGSPSQPTGEHAADGPGDDRHGRRSGEHRRRQCQPLSRRLLDRREAERRTHIVLGGRGGELAANGLGDDEQPSDRRHRRSDAQRGHLDGDRRCDGGTDVAKRRQRLDVDPDRSDDRLDVLDDVVETGGIGVGSGRTARCGRSRRRGRGRSPPGKMIAGKLSSATSNSSRTTATTSTSICGPSSPSSEASVASLLDHSYRPAGDTVRNVGREPTVQPNRRMACSLTITASRSSTRGSSPLITSGE